MTDPFERAVAREELERRERLARHLEAAWRHHLRVYLMVNALLVAIWLATTGPTSHPWPIYPILGWGIGMYFHRAHYHDHMRRDRELRERFDEGR